MPRRTIIFALSTFLLAPSLAVHAAYDIPKSVIAAGGGNSSSVNFSVMGTIGQSVTRVSSSGNYTLAAGFWGGGTIVGPGDIAFVSASSRKIHGAAGDFAIAIDPAGSMTAGQPITVEPRIAGAGYQIVFLFTAPVASAGVNTSSGSGVVSVSGNEATVTLTGVTNKTRVQINLTNVNGTLVNATAIVGFLLGDVTGTSRLVNSTDIATVKASSSPSLVNSTNFKYDINASGSTNSTDIGIVKASSSPAGIP